MGKSGEIIFYAILVSLPCLSSFWAINSICQELSVARYVFVYLYTLSICVFGTWIVYDKIQHVTLLNLHMHIDEWSDVPLNMMQRVLFVYVSGWELSDWVVGGLIMVRTTILTG